MSERPNLSLHLLNKESTVEKYEKIKDNLYATVKFVAEVISVKKDKDGKVIEGNPDKIKFVTDSWKFTRNIKQKILIGICLKSLISDREKI